jgi:class 3 adenylate cyclase
VVFIDVRGFTARAEALGPETVITLLNRYFDQVITATHEHGGTIDKFMGDGIMAYFGAPQRIPNPAAAAVAASKQILNRMGRLNAQLRTEGTEPIEISIGIHAGEAVVGHIGSKERYEYTAIGDVVNVASRLESLTKEVGYALVCTRGVIEEVEDREGFVELGERPIRGHSPIELYGYDRRRGRREAAPPGQAPSSEPAQSATGAQQT